LHAYSTLHQMRKDSAKIAAPYDSKLQQMYSQCATRLLDGDGVDSWVVYALTRTGQVIDMHLLVRHNDSMNMS